MLCPYCWHDDALWRRTETTIHMSSPAQRTLPGAIRLRTGVAVSAVTISLFISACADSNTTSTASTTTSTASTTASTTTSATAEAVTTSVLSATTTTPGDSWRGERYCEVLVITPVDGSVNAEVYNSWPLNTCPEDLWTALDPAALAAENDAPLVLLNGPRYWLMDSVEKSDTSEMMKASFGGIDMYRQATVDVGPMSDAMTPYTTRVVERSTVFTFNVGQTVYELTAPTGEAYVMQSWSQTVDPTLDEADLPELGTRLALPAGWTYSSRTLTSPLRVDTTITAARVLQDDLQNSYSLETPA